MDPDSLHSLASVRLFPSRAYPIAFVELVVRLSRHGSVVSVWIGDPGLV